MKLVVDLKPALTEEVLRERIAREIADMEPTEFFTELLRKLVPKPLVLTLVHEMDVNGKNYVSKITEEQIGRLIKTLKGFTFPLTDYAPFEYAVVTAGGVCCDEVNPYTMESLKVRGLYLSRIHSSCPHRLKTVHIAPHISSAMADLSTFTLCSSAMNV